MLSRVLALVLIPVLVICVTPACSSVQLAYNNADWWLVRELDRHLCATPRQREELQRVVKRFMAWHRRHELPRYARHLRRIGGAVRRGPVTRELLDEVHTVLDGARARAARQLRGPLVAFGLTLGRRQIGCIAARLTATHRERLDELGGSPAAHRARALDRLVDRLEPWFGDITPAQRRQLAALLPSQGQAREVARARYNRGLRLVNALSSPSPERERAWLGAWVSDPYGLCSARERRLLEQHERRRRRLIGPLLGTLSAEQRARFAQKALAYARAFEALAARR
jgi:hypothetical protein